MPDIASGHDPCGKSKRASAVKSDCEIMADFRRKVGACESINESQFATSRNLAQKTSHVPTRNGAASFRNVAMIESATILPVLGFSEGTFSIESVNEAESASTSIT
jgi:hypothetical protein